MTFYDRIYRSYVREPSLRVGVDPIIGHVQSHFVVTALGNVKSLLKEHGIQNTREVLSVTASALRDAVNTDRETAFQDMLRGVESAVDSITASSYTKQEILVRVERHIQGAQKVKRKLQKEAA